MQNLKKKWTKRELSSLGFFTILVIIPILHFFVFYIGTNLNSLLLAFTNNEGFTLDYFKLFFEEIQLTGATATLREGILNSLTIFAMSIVIILPASLLFSYFLYKKILFHKYFRIVFFLPNIISAVVLVALYENIVNEAVSPLMQSIFNMPNKPLLLGIEGEHYSINEQNEYTELENSTNYAAFSTSVSWAIKNGDLTEGGVPEREKAITDAWEERVVMNPTITFVFDDTNVKSYMSAVDSVLADYIPMLQLGLVDDVDATIDECVQKCYDAGLQNIYDEFNTQYDAWVATRG